ncbi:MAG: hypothetical protein WBP45_14900 [Daejeonella sp.]
MSPVFAPDQSWPAADPGFTWYEVSPKSSSGSAGIALQRLQIVACIINIYF